jgi:hypothetical protein
MNPNDIKLESMNRAFEYEKLSRDIDTIDNIDDLRNFSKYFLKLYLKQQEVISTL